MTKIVYDIKLSDIKLKLVYQNHNIERFVDKILIKHVTYLENMFINVNDEF